MNKIIKAILLCTLILLSLNSRSQIANNVKKIDVLPNKITTLNGTLESGEIISDLQWASKSNVACFPATQNTKFRGNHVLQYFEIPPYSEVTITLIPKNKRTNSMSL